MTVVEDAITITEVLAEEVLAVAVDLELVAKEEILAAVVADLEANAVQLQEKADLEAIEILVLVAVHSVAIEILLLNANLVLAKEEKNQLVDLLKLQKLEDQEEANSFLLIFL
jgi:hypothetical protein